VTEHEQEGSERKERRGKAGEVICRQDTRAVQYLKDVLRGDLMPSCGSGPWMLTRWMRPLRIPSRHRSSPLGPPSAGGPLRKWARRCSPVARMDSALAALGAPV